MVATKLADIMLQIQALIREQIEARRRYRMKNLVSHAHNVVAYLQAISPHAVLITMALDVHATSLNFAYDR